MDNIKIKTPAKINLTLDILSKRPDGYHEVEMIMQTVDLYDIITIKKTPKDITLDSNNIEIPLDSGNIAYRAAKLLMDNYSIKGVDIYIEKHIPVAAGLAGGSTNAAAVLMGINKLYNLNIPKEQLAALALTLGADVPYCLMGGTALAQGIGEKLTPLKPMAKLWVLLSKINAAVSTAQVYKAVDLNILQNRPDTKAALSALEQNNISNLSQAMGNVLEPITANMYPQILEIKEQMLLGGSIAAMMSGSGPTVFGLFDDYQKATNTYDKLKKAIPQTYLVVST